MTPRPRRAAALLLLLLLPRGAGALDTITAPAVDSRTGEVFRSEMLIVANTADLQGDAARDLFVAAGKVAIAGTCAGDVWALCGESLRLTGVVEDDARLTGQSAEIEGRIDGTLSALATSVRLGTGAVVGGTANITAGDAILLGEIRGDLRVTGTRVTLGGRIGGTVTVTAAEVVYRPGLDIGGDLVLSVPDMLRPPPGTRIGGTTRFLPPQEGPSPWLTLALLAGLYAGGVLAGLPLVVLAPRFASRASLRLRQSWPRAMLSGLAALLAVPAMLLFSFSWTVTMPLGLVLAAAWGFAAALSVPLCAIALGGALLRLPHAEVPAAGFVALAVGMAPLVLAASMPGAGLTILLLVVVFGTGTLAAMLRPTRPAPPAPPPLP
ncbi:MAG: polymer-forming cytoskeletal protein [Lentisphaerae bacterium]|nr:polymer-forming cytoskeletal protein [Lentisphaerota bacterium]